jgi:surface protein
MTKNESAERAARDKKSQDNKDRLQAEDKQRRSEANERRAINEQNRKEKWGNADKAVVGGIYAIGPVVDWIIKWAAFGTLILIAVLFLAIYLGEAILYLSSALSWVSYPFHFLFGNTDFFDLKSLTAGSQLDKELGDMLVFSGQFWIDFLILLVVSVIAVIIFYKIINFKNKATRARNASLVVIVYIVGSFITTNTNYTGNGLINKDAQIIGETIPFVKLFGGAGEHNKYLKQEKLKVEEAAILKAKIFAEKTRLNSIKTEKTLSLAPNYDDYAKKLNASVNSLNSTKAINVKFRKIVNSEIERLGDDADLNHLDTSNVTYMRHTFVNPQFNGDISKWDVSKVTNMQKMFYNSKFNGDITNWDVSKVTNMRKMFYNSKFNGDITNWDVSKVTKMDSMFYNSKFNGDISKWDVSNVPKMDSMFSDSKFNGDISKWDVSKVKDMQAMFAGSKFNGDISQWNVSKVKRMDSMFYNSKFNGDISKWDVSKVWYMRNMFSGSQFNGDISKWTKKPEGYKRK